MKRPAVLAALTFVAASVLAACTVGGRTAEVAFALLAMSFPPLLMLLGVAGPDGRFGTPARPILALFLLLEAAVVGMLALRGTVETAPWLLGLPAGAAIMLYGVFLLPLALVALGYALTFGEFGVSEADLARLRSISRRSDSE